MAHKQSKSNKRTSISSKRPANVQTQKRNAKLSKANPFVSEVIKKKIYELIIPHSDPHPHKKVKRKFGHHTIKELKQYFSNEIEKFIPYSIAEGLFTEEAGGFCQNKKTGKIHYNSNYWKVMFESPDDPKCDWDEEDLVLRFHSHPYGYPRPSTGDLQVAIRSGSEIWSCLGAGTPYNKRVLCIKPKQGKTFDNLMDKLYGEDWKKFLETTTGRRKIHQTSTEYDELLPFHYRDDAHIININVGKDEPKVIHILPDNLERKVFNNQIKWIKDSGLFNVKLFECKDNDLIEIQLPKEKIKVDQKEVGNLSKMMGFYHETYDIWIDPTPLEKIDWDWNNSTDIAGMITSCDYEIEHIKNKKGETVLKVLHSYLTIVDESGEVDIELSNITEDWLSMLPNEASIDRLVRNGKIVGKFVSIRNAKKMAEKYLKVDANMVRIEPKEELEKFRSWL